MKTSCRLFLRIPFFTLLLSQLYSILNAGDSVITDVETITGADKSRDDKKISDLAQLYNYRLSNITCLDFNVSVSGIIINNSMRDGNSKLMGASLGNSNFLPGREAILVHNQVTSSNECLFGGK